MKKTLFFLFGLLTVASCFAQIKTTKVASPVKNKVVFDSTKNFLGDANVESYQGQLLYVLPKRKSLQLDYWDFVPKAKYTDVANKYFYVTNVQKGTEPLAEYIFTLEEKDNPTNIKKYEYNEHSDVSFPFLVVSHYNWLKKQCIGKKFIIYDALINPYDIVTGEKIKIIDDTKIIWECSDVTIVDNEDQAFALILKSGNITTYITVEDYKSYNGSDKLNLRGVYTKSEWDKGVSKNGLGWMKKKLHRQK